MIVLDLMWWLMKLAFSFVLFAAYGFALGWGFFHAVKWLDKTEP